MHNFDFECTNEGKYVVDVVTNKENQYCQVVIPENSRISSLKLKIQVNMRYIKSFNLYKILKIDLHNRIVNEDIYFTSDRMLKSERDREINY